MPCSRIVNSSPSSRRPTGSARRSGTAGIGSAAIDDSQCVPADQFEDEQAGPRGSDAAGADPEPVGEFRGPVGERLRRLAGDQPDAHQVRAGTGLDTCPSTGRVTRPRYSGASPAMVSTACQRRR